jgi:hypothetical protein
VVPLVRYLSHTPPVDPHCQAEAPLLIKVPGSIDETRGPFLCGDLDVFFAEEDLQDTLQH